MGTGTGQAVRRDCRVSGAGRQTLGRKAGLTTWAGDAVSSFGLATLSGPEVLLAMYDERQREMLS